MEVANPFEDRFRSLNAICERITTGFAQNHFNGRLPWLEQVFEEGAPSDDCNGVSHNFAILPRREDRIDQNALRVVTRLRGTCTKQSLGIDDFRYGRFSRVDGEFDQALEGRGIEQVKIDYGGV